MIDFGLPRKVVFHLSYLYFIFLFFLFSKVAGAETRFLGDYPKDREPGWSSECQGVTHDDSFWYITQKDRLWKFPVSFDLNRDVWPAVKSGMVKYVGIPDILRNQGYNHFGDLDYFKGYLFIPVEEKDYRKPAKIAVFRAQDLTFVAEANLDAGQGGTHAMACAINPRDGQLYVSQFRHNDDSSIRVLVYRQEIRGNQLILNYIRKVTFFGEDGRTLYPKRIQGLAFSRDTGLLYLVSDTGSSGGIFIFDLISGKRLQRIKVDYDPSIFGEIREELEGITVWNLDHGKSPNISGQVHLIMIDNVGTGDDDLYFKHFSVPGERHLAGQQDCLPINIQNLRIKKAGSEWELSDGWQRIGLYKNEAEALKVKSVLIHYNLNEHCFVGRPNSKFEYYLTNGQSPQGSFPGEDCLGFNPIRLEMKWLDGRWLLVDGGHRILDFDQEGLECLASLQIIKKYAFNYICFLGRPKAYMVYFRK